MTTMTQVKTGLMRYIDNEVLPHLTGVKKIGLGIYTALAAENLEKQVMKYINNPAIAMLEVFDANGNLDVGRLYDAAVPYFNDGARHVISIPLIGDMTIDRNDLEKLYRYINN